jgi:hypothetical protein
MSKNYSGEQKRFMGIGLALGIIIGASIGAVFGNIALGIGPGMALGLAIGIAMANKHRPKPDNNNHSNHSRGSDES